VPGGDVSRDARPGEGADISAERVGSACPVTPFPRDGVRSTPAATRVPCARPHGAGSVPIRAVVPLPWWHVGTPAAARAVVRWLSHASAHRSNTSGSTTMTSASAAAVEDLKRDTGVSYAISRIW